MLSVLVRQSITRRQPCSLVLAGPISLPGSRSNQIRFQSSLASFPQLKFMLSLRPLYRLCRERKRLFNFIKEIYASKIEVIEDTMITANEIPYTVQVLQNSRYFAPEMGERLAKVGKVVLGNHDLTKLKSPTLAVEIIDSLYQYFQKDTDEPIMTEVFLFYKQHPYLFDQPLLSRLEYLYYTLEKKHQFQEPIQIDVKGAEPIINTRMFTPVAFELWGMKPKKHWNISIKHDPDMLTSASTLQHKKGKNIRVQGINRNHLDDLTYIKTLITEKQFEVVLLDFPPFEKKASANSFKVLDKITSMMDKPDSQYKDIENELYLDSYESMLESFKSKYFLNENKNIVIGVQQGFEVPFFFESLIYHYSRQERPPIMVACGMTQQERLRAYLGSIPESRITDALQYLRMKWLNELMEWIGKVQKVGCFTCGSQSERCYPPSQIIDSVVREGRAHFLAEMVLNYVGSSGKQNFLVLLEEGHFYETVKVLVEGDLKNGDIEQTRSSLLKKLPEKNLQYQSKFMQFYEDQVHTNRIYKFCETELLDLNRISKLKYKPGQQIKCGARELLF